MDTAELFDRVVAHGVTAREIAQMDPAQLERHIAELRRAEPDGISFSDRQIAEAIRCYALATVESVGSFHTERGSDDYGQ